MVTENDIFEALKNCYDPEIPVNIVDLGLVYGIDIDEDKNVVVTMTLTTPGCPMHDSISTGVQNRVRYIKEIKDVEVKIVWEPQWNPSKMSDHAKEMLW